MILEALQNNTFINLSYILASVLFIFGLKMLSSPDTAQRGNFVSSLGMLLAVVVTLLSKEIVSFQFILIGLIGGGAVGAIAALRIKMTSMPELVALLNGFGGASSLLVASAELFALTTSNLVAMIAIGIATIIGGVTFSGSLIAFGKLSEIRIPEEQTKLLQRNLDQLLYRSHHLRVPFILEISQGDSILI